MTAVPWPQGGLRDTAKPSKEQVRCYLAQRRAERCVPPAPAEIRRRIGCA